MQVQFPVVRLKVLDVQQVSEAHGTGCRGEDAFVVGCVCL